MKLILNKIQDLAEHFLQDVIIDACTCTVEEQ